MATKIKIKSDGYLRDAMVTTESGDEIPCSNIQLDFAGGRVSAILTIPCPFLKLEIKSKEKINGRNDSV